MKKTWIKANATYTMVGAGHEKGLRRNFTNVVEDVSDEQLTKFGAVLADLSGDSFEKVVVNNATIIAE
ncbi:hypothetical protein BGL34_05765 [Fructilactobacillus lindneri]|uniref:DUF1659 domain-containing protein n=2 Tax=Fructilactobacillus lindneri TaxID=53444 RepID=A0A0R2JSK5_9LACO|nr:hypothetical protein [Fructilactobacillus lindneri]ANZ57423.1 hypothetical protein AYR60_00790 [Fructilactobacillus lindneri]ANZ58690.1 hypothetical protein AYR59_00790 [Fructilactobacillus lindneri]KRN80035.1 hypothetical protein IV52_GL000153 [Fructilactobacillus lindneri DSM 20690 = JCM 11027]POG97908.1 hypothetical protein BGL31_05230 [Fructilactobacillus lindneri]POG99240.1 hypothetical protein BGL32_05255 [Fructilactobacillus lindneri]